MKTFYAAITYSTPNRAGMTSVTWNQEDGLVTKATLDDLCRHVAELYDAPSDAAIVTFFAEIGPAQ